MSAARSAWLARPCVQRWWWLGARRGGGRRRQDDTSGRRTLLGRWTLLGIVLVGTSGGGIALAGWPTAFAEEPGKNAMAAPAHDCGTLPGRPGTLTAEQDARLKEFWRLTLQTFGLEPTAEDSRTASSPVDDRAGRVRRAMFGLWKKRQSDEAAEPAADQPADDKHNVTRHYLLAQSGQMPEEIRRAFWSMVKGDQPDGLLLRFLRARKWEVDKALVMLLSTMYWRLKVVDVETLMARGEQWAEEHGQEGFMKQIRLGKSFLHGQDNQGRPITVVRARMHYPRDQKLKDMEDFTVWLMETARLMLVEPVDTATVIFDLSDFSLANMDNGPTKFLIKCFEAHYPESLGVAILYKAPWIFQSVWKLVRNWLDPVVSSKIHFANSATELEEFIDRDRILQDLGGPEEWSYQYKGVVQGENDKMLDTETRDRLQAIRDRLSVRFEDLTKQWIRASEKETKALWQERLHVGSQIRSNYWDLDPYVRARTVYDRTGELGLRGGFIYQNGIRSHDRL